MQQLQDLADGIYSHSAINNSFFDLWINSELSIDNFGIFARNYYEFTCNFPNVLLHLILNTTDLHARVEYAKILYSELGSGNSSKAHSVLFENFCVDLSKHTGQEKAFSQENMSNRFILLPETSFLISGEKSLYSDDLYVAAGAQLALECQAYSMLSQLYDGARNYLTYWPNRHTFHESCEFFYVHIGSTEKDHRNEALNAATRIITTKTHLEKAIYGFNTHLDLFAQFWQNIYAAICKTD